jgi:hypothetical protein
MAQQFHQVSVFYELKIGAISVSLVITTAGGVVTHIGTSATVTVETRAGQATGYS